MLFLKSDEPSRLQRARSTVGDAARSAAADRTRALRLLIVPVAIAVVVLCVRAARTRSAAGEDAGGDDLGKAPTGADESASANARHERQLQPSGNRATS